MTSAPQSRRFSSACCFMVDLPGRKSHAWISAPSACHRTEGQVLGANLNCSESVGDGPGPVNNDGRSLLHRGILIWTMSALGQKQTSHGAQAMSALPPKADKY